MTISQNVPGVSSIHVKKELYRLLGQERRLHGEDHHPSGMVRTRGEANFAVRALSKSLYIASELAIKDWVKTGFYVTQSFMRFD